MSQDYDFLSHTLSDNSPSSSFPEIQGLFEALLSSSSGTSAPTTLRPGMVWMDTSASALKIRNAGNTEWITLFTFSGGPKAPTAVNAENLGGKTPAHYDDIPGTTKMLFYQASAPVGWTQDTAVNDRVLRVVSGLGGGTGGGWTITGLNVLGHTLTEAQIPAHDHTASVTHNANTGTRSAESHTTHTGNDVTVGHFNNASISVSVGNAGGGGSHSHGISHNGGWRPSYINVISAARVKP